MPPRFPTKTCPECKTDVLITATRCKSCFADLDTAPANNGVRSIVAAVLIALVVAGVSYAVVTRTYDQTTLDKVTWDEEQQRAVLVWTSTRAAPRTQVIEYADVTQVEMRHTRGLLGGDIYEVFVHTRTEQLLVNRHDRDLQPYAAGLAENMGATLVVDSRVEESALTGLQE